MASLYLGHAHVKICRKTNCEVKAATLPVVTTATLFSPPCLTSAIVIHAPTPCASNPSSKALSSTGLHFPPLEMGGEGAAGLREATPALRLVVAGPVAGQSTREGEPQGRFAAVAAAEEGNKEEGPTCTAVAAPAVVLPVSSH